MSNKPKAQKEIELFVQTQLTFSSYAEGDAQISSKREVGATTPAHISKILERLWVAGKELRRDIDKEIQYRQGDISSHKRMSNHKRMIAINNIKRLSEEYIVTVLRAHHYLTFILYPFTVKKNHIYQGPTHICLNDILDSKISMTEILKHEKVKEIFDSGEKEALHSFNYLRNSLAHSADYVSFIHMTPEYHSSIKELIGEVQDIFTWVSNKNGQDHQRTDKKIASDVLSMGDDAEVNKKNYPFA